MEFTIIIAFLITCQTLYCSLLFDNKSPVVLTFQYRASHYIYIRVVTIIYSALRYYPAIVSEILENDQCTVTFLGYNQIEQKRVSSCTQTLFQVNTILDWQK